MGIEREDVYIRKRELREEDVHTNKKLLWYSWMGGETSKWLWNSNFRSRELVESGKLSKGKEGAVRESTGMPDSA